MEGEFGMRRWALVAFALLVAVGIGVTAYQAGVSEGISLQPPPVVTAPAPPGNAQAAPPAYAYDYRYDRRWRGGLGWFGPVFSIIFFVFVMRAIFWGLFGWGWRGGWRRRRWYYDHPDDYGPSRGAKVVDEVMGNFDEWHRRAHDRMRDDRAPSAPGA